jgi:mono/diheme cytochrome c family protein
MKTDKSKMMRGTMRSRLLFAVLSPVFLVLCVVAIRSEEVQPWVRYQQEFARVLGERARAKLAADDGTADEKQKARWQRLVEQAEQWQPEMKQIYLEDIQVADRCTTCHLGVDIPLLEDAPEPFRTHPGDLLRTHDPMRFGCTMCHDGQGLATTTEEAHGDEENWNRPMLPTAYVQVGCARCHEITHGLAGAEVVTWGADLFMSKGCYGCHEVTHVTYLPKYSPPLDQLQLKLRDTEDWVYAWVKDPQGMRKGTLMPDFHLTDEEVADITAFLMTFKPEKRLPAVNVDGASAEEGRRLFTDRGCRGCHAADPKEKSASPRIPHLAGIASKVTVEWLDEWIADPKRYNPDASMPKIELTDEERRAMLAYLMTLERTEPLPAPAERKPGDPEKGKELLKHYECYGCHAVKGFEQVKPSVPGLAEFARKPLDELDFGTVQGLPRTKWDWLRRKFEKPRDYETKDIKLKMPTVPLTQEESDALVAFSLTLDRQDLPSTYARRASDAGRAWSNQSWMVEHLHCGACHRLDDDEPHIAQFFERQSRVPPMLKEVGGRLQGDYMYKFLLEPKQVRPWLTMRMPTFGFTEERSRMLVDGFAAAARVDDPYTFVPQASVDQERFEHGFRRFRLHKCIQCHPSSIEGGLPEDLDPDDLSIDLWLSKERLRPEWLADFMARPKEIAGNQTRMPTVFYTVEGRPKVDDPKREIDDIVLYLMTMKESPEVTLARYAEEEAVEDAKKEIDWSTYEY